MATVEYHTGERGYPGFTVSTTAPDGKVYRQVIPAYAAVDSTGNTVGGGSVSSPSFTQTVNAKGQYPGMPTYVTSGVAYAGYATPTDMLVLSNPGTKTILVTQAQLQIAATASTTMTLFFIRRSALNTGGTSTTSAIASIDSTNAAATAVATLYTAAPTTNGTAATVYVLTSTASAGGAGTVFGLQSASHGQTTMAVDFRQPITLRQNESLALNLAGAALPAGFAASYLLEWVEG